MENIQNKSALIPSDEIRSEELLAEQKFEAFITSLAQRLWQYGRFLNYILHRKSVWVVLRIS